MTSQGLGALTVAPKPFFCVSVALIHIPDPWQPQRQHILPPHIPSFLAFFLDYGAFILVLYLISEACGFRDFAFLGRLSSFSVEEL
jgi:hypothetical protein